MAVIKQKIVPHLWFDKEAREAADFYSSVFPNSGITSTNTLHNTPSGDCDVVSLTVFGQPFMAISAGPLFKFNPSISFMVNFDPSQDADAKTRIDAVWAKLAEGGKVLMPIDRYPFSERYGWVEDKYGLSWQLILTNPEGEERPLIHSVAPVRWGCVREGRRPRIFTSRYSKTRRGERWSVTLREWNQTRKAR